jgi:hypothetical protein
MQAANFVWFDVDSRFSSNIVQRILSVFSFAPFDCSGIPTTQRLLRREYCCKLSSLKTCSSSVLSILWKCSERTELTAVVMASTSSFWIVSDAAPLKHLF